MKNLNQKELENIDGGVYGPGGCIPPFPFPFPGPCFPLPEPF